MSRYKYCLVPECLNSAVKTPNIIFFDVPRNNKVRKKWCNAMKRDSSKNPPLSATSVRHVCQDHFNIETDTKNFMQYRLQNVKLRLKKGVIPHRFDCQKPKKAASTAASERAAKRQRRQTLLELLEDEPSSPGALPHDQPSSSGALPHDQPSSPGALPHDQPSSSSTVTIVHERSSASSSYEKSVQVNIKPPFRSKATNTFVPIRDFGCTVRPDTQAVACGVSSCNCEENSSSSDGNDDEELENCSVNEYGPNSSDSDYEPIEDVEKDKQLMRNCIVDAIKKNTLMCLGIPQHASFLLQFLSKKSNSSELEVLITLKKIRQNETNENLGMLFAMSYSNIAMIFKRTLPRLAGVLQNLIVWPSNFMKIRENLPISFRKGFYKVESIIDTFEIPIEKPTNALHQSLTWSDYYKSNTIKYLISCTPDGMINFISKGYGGRASDAVIFEDSGYLNMLNPLTEVLADRGFKNIAYLIEQQQCKLVRPPSMTADQPMSAEEVKETKRVAAVRVHVERVIGRLRHFSILSKHTCVDHNLVNYFDYVLIVASGLINLQSKEFQ